MMARKLYLGSVDQRALTLTPAALLAAHSLFVASSGGGKSWLIRRLLEETFGQFPHLVIDPEGELRTLREKYDYIIASADDDGDCRAHPSTAKVLALKLLELNASCIIDIYELPIDQQVMFVRDFTTALIAAPKKLWGPRLVVIDEAHLYAPEKQGEGQASRRAVVDLLSRGRKRGLGVVIASQRIAKLSKDAMSECRNKAYGFCNLLADRKRATEDLGFIAKTDQERFRQLDVGQFYVTGPALSPRAVKLMKVSTVRTTHPKAGEVAAHTPPPRTKVKKQLVGLKDLPKQARAEAETLAQAKAEIKDLRRQVRGASKPSEVTPAAVKQLEASKAAADESVRKAHTAIKSLRRERADMEKRLKRSQDHMRKQGQALLNFAADVVADITVVPDIPLDAAPPPTPKPTPALTIRDNQNEVRGESAGFVGIVGGARRMVVALVRSYPAQVTKSQLATLSKMKKTGGSFSTYLSRIRAHGLIEESGGLFQASESARSWLGYVDGAPRSNEELVELWARAVQPAKCGAIIRLVRGAHPSGYTKDQLAEALGMTASGGSFNTYLSRVRSNGLITERDGMIVASEELLRDPE